jgi:hypothetical protein
MTIPATPTTGVYLRSPSPVNLLGDEFLRYLTLCNAKAACARG